MLTANGLRETKGSGNQPARAESTRRCWLSRTCSRQQRVGLFDGLHRRPTLELPVHTPHALIMRRLDVGLKLMELFLRQAADALSRNLFLGSMGYCAASLAAPPVSAGAIRWPVHLCAHAPLHLCAFAPLCVCAFSPVHPCPLVRVPVLACFHVSVPPRARACICLCKYRAEALQARRR